jgi:uncharacterized cupin superfamily protein
MPHIITPDPGTFSQGQFNRPPFGLLTMLPNMHKEAGAKNLIFDLRTLPPKEFSFPYHYHRNAEEVMYVISGSLTLRSPGGFSVIHEGQVLFCETGEQGAHQFFNHTDTPCTYFDVKTFFGMDVVVYPDSDKIMISQYNETFEVSSKVDYFTGESDVAARWSALGFETGGQATC